MSSGTTEFLNYTGPVPVDKTFTATGVRWSGYTPSGIVNRFITTLIIPTFSGGVPNGVNYPYAVTQFNYQTGNPFSLLDFNSFNNIEALTNAECYMAIRWYIANTGQTFRYMLPTKRPFPQIPPAQLYNGVLIGGSFVIEIYNIPGASIYNNPAPIILSTSLTTLPSPLTDVTSAPASISPSMQVTGDLFLPLGNSLPYVFPSDGPWIGN